MTMLTKWRIALAVCLAVGYSSAVYVQAQTLLAVPRDPSDASLTPIGRTSSSLDIPLDSTGTTAASGAGMMAVSTALKPERGIAWPRLFESSLMFLSTQHLFRYATEAGTRDAFHTAFWPGYFDSVGNLHGWGDGDPFYVNYVGHPMQGAVTGFMWQQNDRAYRTIEFGRNRRYWKGKLRAAAFAYIFSLQFEIGPISEASLGHIQETYPQQGFVDHVITPTLGMGWAIAEDSVDRYIVRFVESRTKNPYVRLFARAGLNPSRSVANAMNRQLPWHRDDRPGVFKPYPEAIAKSFLGTTTEKTMAHPPSGVAPFEFTVSSNYRAYVGGGAKGSCMGGGGAAAFRVAPEWQIIVDVNGCKMLDLPTNVTGDSLNYMVGPRWTPSTPGRWNTHAQFLVGGTKLTQERVFPEERAEVVPPGASPEQINTLHHLFTKQWDTNNFAIAAGTGVDYKINNALALRVASLEYSRSWTPELNGINYQNGLQLTTGLVLRMGTW